MSASSQRNRHRLSLVRVLLVALAAFGLYAALAASASQLLWKENPDYRCVAQLDSMAPPGVHDLDDGAISKVRGELTLIPIGLRCWWPIGGGVWTDDGWARTLIAGGGLMGCAVALVVFAKSKPRSLEINEDNPQAQ